MIALVIKPVRKPKKIFPITARNAIAKPKPCGNAGPSDMSQRRDWICLRGSIALWAMRLRKTRPGPLHGIGEERIGWGIESVWHGKGRLGVCNGIGRRTVTAMGWVT